MLQSSKEAVTEGTQDTRLASDLGLPLPRVLPPLPARRLAKVLAEAGASQTVQDCPVNLEVSAALTRMDFGKDVTRIWQRLDEFVTSDWLKLSTATSGMRIGPRYCPA